ncbi:peptidase U32 [Candidatus Vecturithrix granuli]|uniref:Peptidase U32 n=1 Tax=Vecturithrix granuli TaxID=1499967 RepID=A0A081CAV5_VECG1|nr:peptidase U32 [Candidatus Vecturithrix granuli]
MDNVRPELILPAGTLEKLQFACAYGADAVYAGMPRFSLRARTNSFTQEQLAEGIEYAHERGVKVYVTLNIFARNTRIASSLDALRALIPLKPDAIVMSDPGLIMLARQEFPDIVLHLSTQANTMNWAAVQFWKTQGIQRIILPRELSIAEIKEIHAQIPDMELEVFVHGAMCISYSGRCLLSSYLAHREANLGVCTNSCRWKFKVWEGRRAYALEEAERSGELFPIEEDEHGTYILNSKDLCAIGYLQDLWEAGVSRMKVEGRTKSVYYLAHIGRAYRRAIDRMLQGQSVDAAVFDDIHATANRGLMAGFLIQLPEEVRQNYELGHSFYSRYQFGGIVRTYHPAERLAEIEVKNQLRPEDKVEFVSPQSVVSQTLTAMYDLNRQPISAAHGGAENILIAAEHELAPFTLLRIPIAP